jgi:hypothetical protein
MRHRTSSAVTLLAIAGVLVLAGQALASTWDFSWSGWRGGTRDSNTWSAQKAGNHTWVKETCHADAPLSGGTFKVEIRKVRSLQPDQSLGSKTYTCSNTDESKSYASPGSGPHKFRFPSVQRGDVGISGTGHVNFP